MIFAPLLTFSVVFMELEVKVVTNWSTRLEKHQTSEILHKVDFLCILKNNAFSRFFPDF